MAAITKNFINSSGSLSEVDFYSSDGKLMTKADYYSNGLIQKELTFAADGITVLTSASFTYFKNILLNSIVKTPDGKIQSIVQYNSDGKSIHQTDKYSYDSNGILTSISSNDAAGHLLQTVTYSYASQSISNSNTTGALNQLIETATYSYNAYGQVSKVTHSDNSSAIVQVDKYIYQGINLSQISKTNAAGVLLENDFYARDGKTLIEIDAFKYSANGVLNQENISNGLKQLVYVLNFDSTGKHIKEVDYNQYSGNGQVIASFKADANGQIFEENDFRGSQLTQTIIYDISGNVKALTSYAADGTTINQLQNNYFNVFGQLSTSTVFDANKHIIENDKYAYDNSGKLTSELRYNSSGLLIEQDKFTYQNNSWGNNHNFSRNQTEQRYNASGQLFEIDNLQNGFITASTSYVNGILSAQSSYASNGQLSQTIQFAQDGIHTTEIDTFNFGLISTQDFYANSQLQTEIKFTSDGLYVQESDNYFYTSSKLIDHVTRSASGQIFETDTYKYTANGQLSEIDKFNSNGIKFEIDYFTNGNFNHAIQPVPAPPPVNVPVTPVAPVNSHWSAVSGWGEANVLSALDLVTNHNYTAAAAPVGMASDLKAMGFQSAWANGFTGQGVVIADIDTGLDLKNTALVHSLNLSSYNWNFINNSSNVQDDNGHGSVTAEELAASSSLGNGVEGGAYGAQLMVLKALDATGSGSDTTLVSAIIYAVNHGANIINMSLGQNGNDQALQSAVQYASDHGVIVVAAAGNDGASTPGFPAAYAESMPNVIAVGATQLSSSAYSMASFSNQAGNSAAFNFVDALGVNINGIGLNNKLGFWSGTSMATPLVAAEAAVLESAHSGLSAAQIVQDIMQTAQTLNFSNSTSTTTIANSVSVKAHTAHTQSIDYSSFEIQTASHDSLDSSFLHRNG